MVRAWPPHSKRGAGNTGARNSPQGAGTSSPAVESIPLELHFWPLGASYISGTTAIDRGTSILNGTVTGTMTTDDAPTGVDAARHAAGAGHVNLASSPVPATTGPHTWMCWASLAATNSAGSGGSSQTLFSAFIDVNNNVRVINDETGGGGKIQVSVYASSVNTNAETTAAAWANNYWTHLCYTWTGSVITIYVNGAAVASASGAAPSKPDASYLGAKTNTTGEITGSMSNVRVWGSVLTASQIASIYRSDLSNQASPTGIPGNWALKFLDNFSGSSINLDKWRPNWLGAADSTITPPVGGVAEDACYDPAQVTVSGGVCNLAAINNPQTVGGHLYPYSSGLIETNNKFNFTFGAVECRLYMPASSGTTIANWPAFWTNGQINPTNGENDVVEGLGGTAKYHYHSDAGAPGNSYPGDCTGWHVWGSRWASGIVEWYLDGVLIATKNTDIQSAPHYVIVDQAVGGSGGPTVIPSTVQIDYVRVWQLIP